MSDTTIVITDPALARIEVLRRLHFDLSKAKAAVNLGFSAEHPKALQTLIDQLTDTRMLKEAAQ